MVFLVYVVLCIGFYFLLIVGIMFGDLMVYLVVLLLEVIYGIDVVLKFVDV